MHLAGSLVLAAEAAAVRGQAKWTSPITSRVLLEVGQSLSVPTYKFKYQPENRSARHPAPQRTTERPDGRVDHGAEDYFSQVWNIVANLSYVTGSHNIKVGVNEQWD